MTKSFILLTALFSLFFLGCQKEVEFDNVSGNSNSVADLNGTWKFINISAKTLAINEVAAGADIIKTITTSEYTTENNTGTVVFNEQSMSYDNLGYSINTIARASMYGNGVLLDTFSMPLQLTIPPTKGQAAVAKVGTDSLYFKNGSFVSAGVSQTTKPSGVKIKREQDKLYLTQRINESGTTIDQGQTVKSTQQAEMVITFQKQ